MSFHTQKKTSTTSLGVRDGHHDYTTVLSRGTFVVGDLFLTHPIFWDSNVLKNSITFSGRLIEKYQGLQYSRIFRGIKDKLSLWIFNSSGSFWRLVIQEKNMVDSKG